MPSSDRLIDMNGATVVRTGEFIGQTPDSRVANKPGLKTGSITMLQRLIALAAVAFFVAACETASQTSTDSAGESSSSTASSSASTSSSSGSSGSGLRALQALRIRSQPAHPAHPAHPAQAPLPALQQLLTARQTNWLLSATQSISATTALCLMAIHRRRSSVRLHS